MLLTIEQMRFLGKYLKKDGEDTDKVIDPTNIPAADKKRLLEYDEYFMLCFGYHGITNYKDLMD